MWLTRSDRAPVRLALDSFEGLASPLIILPRRAILAFGRTDLSRHDERFARSPRDRPPSRRRHRPAGPPRRRRRCARLPRRSLTPACCSPSIRTRQGARKRSYSISWAKETACCCHVRIARSSYSPAVGNTRRNDRADAHQSGDRFPGSTKSSRHMTAMTYCDQGLSP